MSAAAAKAEPVIQWPKQLSKEAIEQLMKVLVVPEELAVWPEGEKVLTAVAPKTIAAVLLDPFHTLVNNRRFAYLWVENLVSGGETKLATATRASNIIRHIAQVDFILKFNWTAWQRLTGFQRAALVDHELQHCSFDLEANKAVIVPHDIEEFGAIVRRWGLWRPDLVRFADDVRNAQLELWGQDPPPPKADSVSPIKLEK